MTDFRVALCQYALGTADSVAGVRSVEHDGDTLVVQAGAGSYEFAVE